MAVLPRQDNVPLHIVKLFRIGPRNVTEQAWPPNSPDTIQIKHSGDVPDQRGSMEAWPWIGLCPESLGHWHKISGGVQFCLAPGQLQQVISFLQVQSGAFMDETYSSTSHGCSTGMGSKEFGDLTLHPTGLRGPKPNPSYDFHGSDLVCYAPKCSISMGSVKFGCPPYRSHGTCRQHPTTKHNKTAPVDLCSCLDESEQSPIQRFGFDGSALFWPVPQILSQTRILGIWWPGLCLDIFVRFLVPFFSSCCGVAVSTVPMGRHCHQGLLLRWRALWNGGWCMPSGIHLNPRTQGPTEHCIVTKKISVHSCHVLVDLCYFSGTAKEDVARLYGEPGCWLAICWTCLHSSKPGQPSLLNLGCITHVFNAHRVQSAAVWQILTML